jgi:hypothetical protein
MNKPWTVLICLAMPVLAAGARPDVAAAAAPVPETYRLLEQRSIFSRERPHLARSWAPLAPTTGPGTSGVPLFTGAVYDETECVALLEDPQSHVVSTIRVGQMLPQGRIEAVTLDYLIVRPTADAQPVRIDLGHTLTGELAGAPAATAPAPSDGAPATATAAPGARPPPSDAGSADVLERMRQKRLKELQGK